MQRKIFAMHRIYGIMQGRCCKECSNFFRYQYRGKMYRKCEVYGATHSEATDWNASYTACRMYNKPIDKYHVPIIERLKRLPKGPKQQETPITGQISIDELIAGG